MAYTETATSRYPDAPKAAPLSLTDKALNVLILARDARRRSDEVSARVHPPTPASQSVSPQPPTPDHLVFILEEIDAVLNAINDNLGAVLERL